MPDPLDPKEPIPRWTPGSGAKRNPERIDVLLEQIARIWKDNPEWRLGQLLVNLADEKPNSLFYVEDHTLSERILLYYRTSRWPQGSAEPPDWALKGERPPPQVRERLRPIFDDITRKGRVDDADTERIWAAIVEPDKRETDQDS